MPTRKLETELKRQTVCVRLNDSGMSLLADEAWRRRTNCSELVRVAVAEKFEREGVKADQPQSV